MDSVISILLHFIMPLSIISTDYMQLDLLYSFLLSAWTDTRRFRLQIHRYRGLYSMKKIGSDCQNMAARGGKEHEHKVDGKLPFLCFFFPLFFNTISKTTTFFFSPPSLFSKIKKNKQKEVNDKTRTNESRRVCAAAGNVKTYLLRTRPEGGCSTVVDPFGSIRLGRPRSPHR